MTGICFFDGINPSGVIFPKDSPDFFTFLFFCNCSVAPSEGGSGGGSGS